MNGWQVLKLALELYWGFMKESPFLGTFLTCASFFMVVNLVEALRGRRVVTQQRSGERGTDAIQRPAPPPRIAPPTVPEPEPLRSRYDRLRDD